MLEWAMSHPSFKTQLFRFVDVFPATTDDEDVVRHLDEYLHGGAEVPKALDLGLELAEHVPLGKAAAAGLARRSITRVAEQFIVGQTPAEAVAGLARLWAGGSASTVDLLGEKTLTEADADRYAARVGELLRTLTAAAPRWAANPRLETDDLGPPAPGQREREAHGAGHPLRPADPGRRPGRRPGPPPPVAGRGGGGRRLRPLRRRALRRQGPHPPALPGPARRVPRSRRRRRHPGLPQGRPRGPGRPDRVGLDQGAARHGAAGERGVLGHRDGGVGGRGLAGARLRREGPDRRQLRALHPHAPRGPRDGAGRVRHPQPPVARLCGGVRPVPRHPGQRLRGPAALRDGRAAARRRAQDGPAPAGVRPGGGARPRHGLPGAPAAGEHRQRELRAPALRRGPGPGRPRRPAGGRPPARARPAGPAGAHGRPHAGWVRARAAVRVAAGDGTGSHGRRRGGRRAGGVGARSHRRPRRHHRGPHRVGRPVVPVDDRRPLGALRAGRGRGRPGGGPPGVAGVAADAGAGAGRRPVPGRRVDAGPPQRAGRPGGLRGGQAVA